MQPFCSNSAKSYLGKRVNLHMRDGSVLANVEILEVRTADRKVEVSKRRGNAWLVAMVDVDFAEVVPVETQLLEESSCSKKARREGHFLVCDCGYKEFA